MQWVDGIAFGKGQSKSGSMNEEKFRKYMRDNHNEPGLADLVVKLLLDKYEEVQDERNEMFRERKKRKRKAA